MMAASGQTSPTPSNTSSVRAGTRVRTGFMVFTASSNAPAGGGGWPGSAISGWRLRRPQGGGGRDRGLGQPPGDDGVDRDAARADDGDDQEHHQVAPLLEPQQGGERVEAEPLQLPAL